MKCKFCSAELEDGAVRCTECGKKQNVVTETAEEKPGKNRKNLKIALAAIGLVLLAEVLTCTMLHFVGVINLGKMFGAGTPDPTGTEVATNPVDATGNGGANNGQTPTVQKPAFTYTADNATVEAAGNTVVATVGNQTLTVSELQIHYWDAAWSFMQSYEGLLVDQKVGLDMQIQDPATGKTYQQWFVEQAVENWRRYAILAQMAEDAGYQLTPEQQKELDNIPDAIAAQAQTAGFADAEAYVEKYYPGSSVEGLAKYNINILKAMYYFDALYDSLMPTAEETEAYYIQHEETFKKKLQSKDDGLYYTIRHIYIPIAGEPGDVQGVPTYSDEQWTQCRDKAKKVLDDFLADGGTEELFAMRAKELSADDYSKASGGLYEKITKNSGYVDTFMEWIMSEDRKPGDTDLVKNTGSAPQGYHVMYFCKSVAIWEYEAQNAILTERTNAALKEAEAKWPVVTAYDKVVLGQATNS